MTIIDDMLSPVLWDRVVMAVIKVESDSTQVCENKQLCHGIP